jgi:hypothetical protein
VRRTVFAEVGSSHRDRLARALASDDPAATLEALLRGLPIPRRLRDVGFDKAKISSAAGQ